MVAIRPTGFRGISNIRISLIVSLLVKVKIKVLANPSLMFKFYVS